MTVQRGLYRGLTTPPGSSRVPPRHLACERHDIGRPESGLPSHYRQYSATFMVGFDLVVLLAIPGLTHLARRPVRHGRRPETAAWIAFDFTVPLAMYDWLYCGVHVGYGIGFLIRFCYLSVYYVIPWVVLPSVALLLDRGAGNDRIQSHP